MNGWWNRGMIALNRSLMDVVSQILWCFYRLWGGRYKRPLASRDFIGLWKEKRYRRNMMFLFAGHFAGLLNNNHVQLKLPWLLESQLHGSRRKSYLSVPFFFHLRYGWLVRGRLYMPNYAVNCTTESAIYVMEPTVMGWVPIKRGNDKIQSDSSDIVSTTIT